MSQNQHKTRALEKWDPYATYLLSVLKDEMRCGIEKIWYEPDLETFFIMYNIHIYLQFS